MRNFIAFVVLLFCVCYVSGIRWTSTDEDGNRYLRVIRVIRTPSALANTFEIRAVKKQIGRRNIDAIDFVFSTEVVPRYVLRYFSRDSDGSNLFMNRWSLWKVFEYVDGDSTPGFDPENDNITSAYRLFNKRWTQMTYHKEVTDDATLHYLCSDLNPVDQSTPFPDVRLCAYFAEGQRQANRSTIHPNALKWAVTISNYPYTVSNSRLGLKVSFDGRAVVRDLAESDASIEDESNEAALDISGDNGGEDTRPRAVASWVTNVEVIGTGCSATSNVVRSVVVDAEAANVRDPDTYPNDPDNVVSVDWKLRVSYFSFPTDCANPDSITWDPEFGVALDDSGAGVVGFSALLMSVLVMIALVL